MFSIIDEQQIIEEVCSAFPKFKKIRDKYEFVCPEDNCSDKTKPAHKNPHGNFFISRQTGHYFYHCYLCGASMNFVSFMRKYAPHKIGKLFKENLFYERNPAQKRIKFNNNNGSCSCVIHDAITEIDISLDEMKSIAVSDLGLQIFPANDWMQKVRHVSYDKAFIVSSAASFYKAFSGKSCPIDLSVAGVVLPSMHPHEYDKIIGFSIRTIAKKNQEKPRLRYITKNFTATPKETNKPVITRPVFGFDRINSDKTIYVAEGQFDALSVDNCVAALSADLAKTAKMAFSDKCDVVVLHDNEPYHSVVIKQIKQSIKMGYDIVLFPHNWPKDLNEMVIRFGRKKVEDYIRNNRIPNSKAMAAIAKWRFV